MKAIVETLPFTDQNGTVWLAYRDYGRPRKPQGRPLVCVHGLTRNARDFDPLGEQLSKTRRVVSIDVVGRGRSGWLADKTEYGIPTYLRHMEALFDYAGLSEFDWLGTSMGGIIGMIIASQAESPIKRLILNDIGAFVSGDALYRYGTRVPKPERFKSLTEAGAYFMKCYEGFGELSEADWSHITINSVIREEDGSYIPHYDPAITDMFNAGSLPDIDLWSYYASIPGPVLALRGEHSELLSRDTLAEMAELGPKAESVEIPNCGHAPALFDPDQIAIVEEWLKRGEETDAPE